MSRFLLWAQSRRWIWSVIGIGALWITLSLVTSRLSLESLSGVAVSAAFLVLPALGQMFVVSTGRGNIDLSIPSVITLSAFVAMNLIGGSNAMLPVGLAAILGLGLLVGAVNAILVLKLRIPAMVATLATGYVLATATLLANREFTSYQISSILVYIADGRFLGVPVIVVTALAAVALSAFVLKRTAYGRMLMAVGQNQRAAELANVPAQRVVTAAFLASGLASALDGALLSAHTGGAFLEMGAAYLLQSVGAVVLGGTLIFGGKSTAFGTLSGAFLLVLIVTTMQIAGLPGGMQEIVEGIVIILVLGVAGELRPRRGEHRRRDELARLRGRPLERP